MKNRRSFAVCSLFGLLNFMDLPPVWGQSSASQKIVVDYGLTAKVDIGGKNNTSFTLSGCLGFGKQITAREIFPKWKHGTDRWGAMASFKFGINLYRGGIGNSKLPSLFDDHQLDFFNSFALTPGWIYRKNGADWGACRRRPLYTWNSNYANSLNNPWQYSLTLATNFVWNLPINGREVGSSPWLQLDSTDKSGQRPSPKFRRSQRVGFIGLAVGKWASAGYYNDGPPFSGWLGDGFDRYWTGGGFVHFGVQEKRAGGDSTGFNNNSQFIVSFDKFTGYQTDAYEAVNKLKLKKVPYKNYRTGSFNRGITRLTWLQNDSAMTLSAIDLPLGLDVQDWIHRAMSNPYHPNIYACSITLGGQYHMVRTLQKKE